MIELRSLGTAEIRTGTATLTPAQEIVFAAALYLVLENGRPLSRSHLASLLWPKVPETARAHRMRQTILQLKKLGVLIDANRDKVELSRGEVCRDIDHLAERDAANDDHHVCLEFLPGYNPRLSERFRDWVDEKRTEAHAVATRILLSQLEHSRLQGNWAAVERIAGKCLSLDSYNETAVLARAEATAMRGGKKSAVSILDRYIEDVGSTQPDLKLPASLLRRRVVERVPDRPALLNSEPPFVGREKEMEVLTQKFADARAGCGSMTLILGDAGIGKSRLSAELGRFAELQGAQLLRVGCSRTDVSRPLSLFVDMVPELREMPGALGCGSETFVWLKRLTEFEQRPDTSRESDSSVLFHNIRSALFDLLDAVAHERCLVILLEDIQWADEASARILMGMVQWCPTRRVLFVLNARPDSNSFLDYAGKTSVNAVALGPLRAEAAKSLLQSMALRSSDEPQPEFVSWCLGVAEGNPFFLQELAHQWIETGHRHEAPPSVSHVLQERLSRLGKDALQIFQGCAVLGDYSTIDRVEAMLKFPPHQVITAVEELNNAAMLAPSTQSGELVPTQLRPRHDFLSSAALSRLGAVSVSFMHRRAAEVLETEFLDRVMPANLLWACAEHRDKAGDRERAFSLIRSCAEHLLEVGLPGDACSAFLRSIDYCGTDARRLAVLPRLAFAYQVAGQWEKCKEALRQCILLSRRNDPTSVRHKEYELLLLIMRHQSGVDYTTLKEDTFRCIEDNASPPAHRVRAAVLMLKLAVDFGEMDTLSSAYLKVVEFLYHPSVPEPSRLELQIIYQTTVGNELVSFEDLKHFAAAARAVGGELDYSIALSVCAAACRISARYEEGLAFTSTALEHAIAYRLISRSTDIKLSRIRLHQSARNFDAAANDLKELRRELEESDNARIWNDMNCAEAWLAIERGDFETAMTVFARMDKKSLSVYSLTRKGFYLALELRILIHAKASMQAIRANVDELERVHSKMRSFSGQDFEAHALYDGMCALGETERGLQHMRAYLLKYRKAKWPLPDELRDLANVL